jgi:hypothetical protein
MKTKRSPDMYGAYIDASDYTNHLIHTGPSTHNGEGLWSQIQSINTYDSHEKKDPLLDLTHRLDKLELDNKMLRLKVLSMEGKFTQEEVANVRKMLMSEDEASRVLADSIIENA